MKKWLVFWLCAAMSLTGVGSLSAQEDALEVMSIAALFPPTEFFVALRLDQAFTDQLDAISVAITSELTAERVQLSELVDALFGQGVYGLARLVRARFAALSLDGAEYLVDDDPSNDQRARLRAVIGHGLGRLSRTVLPALQSLAGLRCQSEATLTTCHFEQEGIFKTLSLDDQHIILLSQPDLPRYPTETLAQQSEFVTALAALPERAYDGVAFINTPHFAAEIRYEGIREMLTALGFAPSQLAAATLGLRLQPDGLQLDAVQRRLPPHRAPAAPLDLTFARFIPATAAVYLQTHDLSRLAETMAGLLGSLSATLSSQEAYASLRQLFRSLFRLDLEGDLLSWAQQSDYALFLDAPNRDTELPFEQLELGFILSGDDPSRMAAVAEGIAEGIARQLSAETGFSAQRSAAATQLSYRDPQFGTLTFLIGATDQFGFFATQGALERILAGKTLEKQLNWAHLERYLLPQPSLLLHADADNATRFLFALAEILERLNSAQFNALPTPQGGSKGNQRFERAVLSVSEGAEGHLRLRLFLLISA